MKYSKKIVIKFVLFIYFVYCVYLITFAGIDFKALDNENLFIAVSYIVGLILCLPANICILVPESWISTTFSSDLCVFIIGLIVATFVVFVASKIIYSHKTE